MCLALGQGSRMGKAISTLTTFKRSYFVLVENTVQIISKFLNLKLILQYITFPKTIERNLTVNILWLDMYYPQEGLL